MAPTVCSKKEPSVRTGSMVMRGDSTVLKNSSSSTTQAGATIGCGGRITHRRSAAARNARLRLFNRRLPDSDSSSDESEAANCFRMDEDRSSASSVSSVGIAEYAPSPNADSDISAGCQCSDRLTVITGSTDSAYGSTRCRYCCSPNVMPPSIAIDAVVGAIFTNDMVVFNRDPNDFSDDSASNYSTYSSVWDSDDCGPRRLDRKYYVGKKPFRSSRELLEIAVKTVKLIKRNQLLQKKLTQLQFETKQFIDSVMANPENQNIHSQIAVDERKEVEA